MIVPEYWAEARVQHRDQQRSVTVRRFGWSDRDQPEAQAMAEARARQALDEILDGRELPRHDPRVAYNGAAGVPIREQVIRRHADAIITRNGYGALCLNTADVLFVDIDYAQAPRARISLIYPAALLAAALVGLAFGWMLHSVGLGIILALALSIVAGFLVRITRPAAPPSGNAVEQIRGKVADFVARHPEWHLRLYSTPSGMRALALHRTFAPDEPAVAECFEALGADPVYVRMCRNQNCFRARLTPKPWRIGIRSYMRPAGWPLDLAGREARQRWVADYDRAAAGFAACRFVERLGSMAEHPTARRVRELHDEQCRATRELPIA